MPVAFTTILAHGISYVAEGLATRLREEAGLHLPATVHQWPQLINALDQHCPDVILLSDDMPACQEGVPAPLLLLQQAAHLRLVLLLQRPMAAAQLQQAIGAGVLGITCMHCSPAQMSAVLAQAAQGSLAVCRHYTTEWLQALRQPAGASGIDEAELKILALLANGQTYREIGSALFLSERTVSRRVDALAAKCGVKGAQQLLVYGMHYGLIQWRGNER